MGLLLAAVDGTATEVYTWTDADGSVHFGDRPGGGDSHAITVTPPAPGVSGSAARRDRTQRLLDAYADERRQRAEDRAQAAAEKERRARRCAAAADERRRFENAARIVRIDAQGNRHVLDGEDYDAAIARARAAEKRWCAKG